MYTFHHYLVIALVEAGKNELVSTLESKDIELEIICADIVTICSEKATAETEHNNAMQDITREVFKRWRPPL